MTKYYLLGLVLHLVLLQSCSKNELIEIEEQNNLSISVSSNTQTEFENELFDLINEHRVSIGLNELVFESTSYYYANEHTDFMIANGSLSHENFSVRAEQIAAKTGAKDISENVAKDYNSPQEALSAWLNSSKHRINLEGNYTHSALSVKPNNLGELYFTQIFIR